jgi:hypothetical protein
VSARSRRHERQRSVSTGHAEHVGAAGRGSLGQGAEIVARLEDDRLNAAFLSRLRETRAPCPPTAGPRVDEEHRPRAHDMPPEAGIGTT